MSGVKLIIYDLLFCCYILIYYNLSMISKEELLLNTFSCNGNVCKNEDLLEKYNRKYKLFKNTIFYCIYISFISASNILESSIKTSEKCDAFFKKRKIDYKSIIDYDLCLIIIVNNTKNLKNVYDLYSYITKSQQNEIRIGVGNEKHLLSRVYESVMEAKDSLLIANRDIKIVDIDDLKTVQLIHNSFNDDRQKIINLFREQKIEDIEYELLKLSEKIRKSTISYNSKILPSSIKRTMIDIILEITHISSDYGVDVNSKLEGQDPYMIIINLDTTPKIINWIMKYIKMYSEEINNIKNNLTGTIMTKSLVYIDENFTSSQLSLSSICQHIGLSQSYFSSLFSKTQGITYKDYVNKKRISLAIDMLSKKQSKISSVAYECGFQSSSYFISVFKKYIGISPKEYREKNCYKKNN